MGKKLRPSRQLYHISIVSILFQYLRPLGHNIYSVHKRSTLSHTSTFSTALLASCFFGKINAITEEIVYMSPSTKHTNLPASAPMLTTFPAVTNLLMVALLLAMDHLLQDSDCVIIPIFPWAINIPLSTRWVNICMNEQTDELMKDLRVGLGV